MWYITLSVESVSGFKLSRIYILIRVTQYSLTNPLLLVSGYILFLALVIDRLHSYIREMRGLKKNLEAVSKQNKTLEEARSGKSDESKPHHNDMASLNEEIKKLKLQLKEKAQEAKDAEAKAVAAQTQSEGLARKYDSLLEDNKHLHEQLQSGGIPLSRSDGKKNA